jgi:hypothetical protein
MATRIERGDIPFRVQFHHVTRDAQTDVSGRGHVVEDHRTIAVHPMDIAVAIAAVAGVLTAAAEAWHVAHQFAVRDLELVKTPHFWTRLCHITWPNDLAEVAVRLRGCFVPGESSGEVCVSEP